MRDLNQVLECFQAGHSVLNLAWPHPGVNPMSGAKDFIGTNVFKGLHKALVTAVLRISSEPDIPQRAVIEKAVQESILLLQRIQSQSAHVSQENFDAAVNLLYFVTGVAWHVLAAHEPNIRVLTSGPMEVESFDELCSSCSWNGTRESPLAALHAAVGLMEKLVRNDQGTIDTSGSS